MLKMPPDIEPEFQGSWEAFLELPDTKNLDPKVLKEGFRILLRQAGVKVKTLHTLKDFFTVNKLYSAFNSALTSKFLLYHLKPQKHTFEIVFDSDDMTNVVHGFKVVGQVKMKAQRFTLDYLLNRMVQVKVLKELPDSLQLDRRTVMRGGEKVTVVTDRCPGTIRQVKPWQQTVVVVNRDMKISIARLKGDHLYLQYEVFFRTEMPHYPLLEKELLAVWRRASIGDLQ